MCIGSTPSAPAAPAQLPEAPTAPVTGVAPGDVEKRRKRAAAGESGTILTGPRGIQDGAATTAKTLLGA